MKSMIQKLARAVGYSIHKAATVDNLLRDNKNLREHITSLQARPDWIRSLRPNAAVRPEFDVGEFSGAALQKLILDYDFATVVDIGAGAQRHSQIFAKNGKQVTAVDFGTSAYFRQMQEQTDLQIRLVYGDFNELNFPQQFDCVWASHVLEHQLNVSKSLEKMLSLLKEGGVLAITVPPLKHEIVGGHVSLWNPGLILYRLVLAGIDCSEASIFSYGYNISVIVKKKSITEFSNIPLEFDCGDIRKLKRYFPNALSFKSNDLDDPFDGDIFSLNW